jgi:hypothetical protein
MRERRVAGSDGQRMPSATNTNTTVRLASGRFGWGGGLDRVAHRRFGQLPAFHVPDTLDEPLSDEALSLCMTACSCHRLHPAPAKLAS